VFLLQFVATAQISKVNCGKMDGDRPRQPANKNCKAVARLMSFAQITCHLAGVATPGHKIQRIHMAQQTQSIKKTYPLF